MTETKFTPGPWSTGHMTDHNSACECRHIFSEGYFGSIASVSKNNALRVGEGGNDSPPEAEAIANAHLIAAAPDLYKVLEISWATLLVLATPDDLSVQETLEIGKAALAKARGETS